MAKPVPPSAGKPGLGATLLKSDAPIPGLPVPDKCRVCKMLVYEAEDSEAFCRERWCPFRLMKRRHKGG